MDVSLPSAVELRYDPSNCLMLWVSLRVIFLCIKLKCSPLLFPGSNAAKLKVVAKDIDIDGGPDEADPPDKKPENHPPQDSATEQDSTVESGVIGLDRETLFPPKHRKLTKKPHVSDDSVFNDSSHVNDANLSPKPSVDNDNSDPEDSVYENVSHQIPKDAGMKQGEAGQVDLCTSGSQEGENLVPTEADILLRSDDEIDEKEAPEGNSCAVIPDAAAEGEVIFSLYFK